VFFHSANLFVKPFFFGLTLLLLISVLLFSLEINDGDDGSITHFPGVSGSIPELKAEKSAIGNKENPSARKKGLSLR
jgi:hypothetical protein